MDTMYIHFSKKQLIYFIDFCRLDAFVKSPRTV